MSKARRAGAVALVTLMPLVGITAWGGTALAQSNGKSNGNSSNGAANSASQAGNAPPGNNGTIKVDGWTMDSGQDNDPHLTGCALSISFYGYDVGTDSASITLTPWAPTAGGHPHTSSTTLSVTPPRRGNQFDGNIQVAAPTLESMFSGVTPAHAGYHLRVEAEVTYSQGSDDKFKMVWVSCPTGGQQAEVATTTTTTTSTTTTTLAKSPPRTPTKPPVTGASLAAGRSVSAATSPVAAADTARVDTASAAVPLAGPATPVAAHGLLAFTGANIAALVGLGLLLIAAGCLLVVRLRRRPGPVSTD